MESVTFSMLGKYGRLGNCMFQIAATVNYALKTGREFYFPEWDGLKYFPKIKSNPNRPVDLTYNHTYFHYEPIPDFQAENIDLIGFFQSKKYFQEHCGVIHNMFDLNATNNIDFKAFCQRELDDSVNYPKCSIHVRRGDYTDGTGYHVMDKEYYIEAAKAIFGKSYEKVNYFIFSDEIMWCDKNFDFPHQLFFDNSEIIDMFMMSSCDHNIIANSSFSWWAAELNKNPDKKVVAPLKWFLRDEYDTKDLYQDKWIKI